MFDRSPSARYAKAADALSKAEAAHRRTLDALDEALMARDAGKVTRLRREAEASERTLAEALDAASTAHRAYWLERREALAADIERLAVTLREYDQLARIVGGAGATPGLSRLQNILITTPAPPPPDCEDGVPTEQPDCQVLADFQGSWRG